MSLQETGYTAAMELLRDCNTEEGFLASTADRANYRRIWGRDGCLTGIAALLSDDDELIEGVRRTLVTLIRNQGPHGEIPSNVDPHSGRVSYGGTAGRVDANLWFLIACGQYWRKTGSTAFIEEFWKNIEQVRYLLGAWEYNNRGLLYIPLTGDWADEYIQNGYVLYDQLLYFQSQVELSDMYQKKFGDSDHVLRDRLARLKHLIRDNYWFYREEGRPDNIYHDILYEKGREKVKKHDCRYWMPFFSPGGYGYRFDGMANVLVSLVGLGNPDRSDSVDQYMAEEVVDQEMMLVPAFHPVISPRDEDWADLKMTFSNTFKNKPYEYHNGGLWPVITGLYAADLAMRGKKKEAEAFFNGVIRATRMAPGEEEWGFFEYIHGREHRPCGTPRLAWSAAGLIMARQALRGKPVFCREIPNS